MKARYDRVEFVALKYMASTGIIGCDDSDLRMDYYHAFMYPICFFNGGDIHIGASPEYADGSAYDAAVRAQLDDPTSVTLRVTDFRVEEPAFVSVEVELIEDLIDAADTYIRAFVLEDSLVVGELTYQDVLCDFAETPLTISQADEIQFATLQFGYENAGGRTPWNFDNCWIAVMVQRDSDRQILQGGSSHQTPPYSFRYYTVGDRLRVGTGMQEFGDVFLFNTGTESDTLLLSIDDSELPPEWDAWISDDSGNHGELELALAPGESADCGIIIQASPDSPGGGTAILTLHSRSGRTGDRRLEYTLITPDTEILLVDDDGAASYEIEYFAPALAATERSFAIWDRAVAVPTGDLLANFDAVVWNCGGGYPIEDATVTDEDREALASYLDGGGALFITGQMIAWEMDWEGEEALAWLREYLGADYVTNANDFVVLGEAGDPIGDGLTLDIAGGDGADNQYYHCQIDPVGEEAHAVFNYASAGVGAARKETENFRSVFFAFGFEAIDNAPDRQLVMQRIVDWLIPDLTGAPDIREAPVLALLSNRPNPFNPVTRLRYLLKEPCVVRLSVFDTSGRLVRILDSGYRSAGKRVITWDGTDGEGNPQPSGIYFSRLEGNGISDSRKMVLLK